MIPALRRLKQELSYKYEAGFHAVFTGGMLTMTSYMEETPFLKNITKHKKTQFDIPKCSDR